MTAQEIADTIAKELSAAVGKRRLPLHDDRPGRRLWMAGPLPAGKLGSEKSVVTQIGRTLGNQLQDARHVAFCPPTKREVEAGPPLIRATASGPIPVYVELDQTGHVYVEINVETLAVQSHESCNEIETKNSLNV